jgi:Heterokaryon incompatibility protein (HET)
MDSLRLLHLMPGSANEAVSCKLESTTFFAKPSFDALSYRWGDGNGTKRIQVNGATVEIKENLWDALYHLRYTDKNRTLWVDALCIDQAMWKKRVVRFP